MSPLLAVVGILVVVTAGVAALWWRQSERLSAALAASATQRQLLEHARAAAESHAARARETTERAHHVRSAFLANMSHEIRTPINGALGMLALALDSELTAEQDEALTTAKRSMESLLAIMNDILDMATIEAGRFVLEPETFALVPAIRQVYDRYAERGRAKGLAVTLDLGANLPSYVRHDRARLVQVLGYLLDNAVKFTDRGSVAVRVSAERASGDDALVIDVRDTGPGIPAVKRETVFEPFQQGDDSTTRPHGGAGLGLAITGHVVRAMAGTVSVEPADAAGNGSAFHIRVPLNATEPPAAGAPARRVRRASLRVLLAEDNPVNQRVTRTVLERAGHSVTIAGDGRAAVDACAQADFDLVLMDLQMPVLGGIDATRAIREWERSVGGRVAIIAVTARTRPGDRDACLAAGMDAFLSKPVSPEDLFASIDAVLGRAPDLTITPRASARTANEVFDEPSLLRTVNDDHALVDELCALFLREAPGQVAAIHGAMMRGDKPALSAAAHSLKGSAATLTARRVAVAARTVETLASRGEWTQMPAAIAEIAERLQELEQRLGARGNAGASTP